MNAKEKKEYKTLMKNIYNSVVEILQFEAKVGETQSNGLCLGFDDYEFNIVWKITPIQGDKNE